VLILLGELTSPLQNLWYFARYLKDRSLVGLSVSLCFPCIVALLIALRLRSSASFQPHSQWAHACLDAQAVIEHNG